MELNLALDPKKLAKKNVGLIAIYVAALVPIGLWFVLIAGGVKGGRGKGGAPSDPKWQPTSFAEANAALKGVKSSVDGLFGKIDKIRKSASADTTEPVFTAKHEIAFTTRNRDLESQVKQMGGLLGERDRVLESWFDKWKDLEAKKEPPHGDFMDTFKGEVERLGQENPKLTGWDPATKKSQLYSELPPNSSGAIRIWQKRFWIESELVAALKATGEARLGMPIVFPAGATTPQAPGAKKPYEMIPVGFGVVMPFRDVPKLVREVLARTIAFRLVRLHVEQMELGGPGSAYDRSKEFPGPPPFRVNETPKKYFDRFTYEAFFENEGQLPVDAAAEEKLVPEPPVKLEVLLDAYDFDMDVVDGKADAAAATPAEDEPPPPPKRKKKEEDK